MKNKKSTHKQLRVTRNYLLFLPFFLLLSIPFAAHFSLSRLFKNLKLLFSRIIIIIIIIRFYFGLYFQNIETSFTKLLELTRHLINEHQIYSNTETHKRIVLFALITTFKNKGETSSV